tara:strand:- start:490 stop:936 length:447 start_codon:yes stop_codon:yes gene_type:complete
MGVDFLMKQLTTLFLSLALALCAGWHSAYASDQIIVVANTSDDTLMLTREQVRNLFMGASVGRDLHPIALPPKHRTRSLFNTKVVGLAESRVQSYWAQMKFTGRRSPPMEVGDEEAMLRYLNEHQNSIGYLTASTDLPDSLKVIYTTE